MGTAERRQSEIETLRKKILTAANEIMVEEGYEKLSIRKIASKIEYSPGIIYHYFKDKSEIVDSILKEEYGNILKIIGEIPIDFENPDKSLINGLQAYIQLMLKNRNQYRAILMNNIGSLQEEVNILEKNISKKRKSMEMLCKLISLGIENGKFRELDAELTAQIIWTSTYGLISRLILEEDVPEKQQQKLIDHHFEILIRGMAAI